MKRAIFHTFSGFSFAEVIRRLEAIVEIEVKRWNVVSVSHTIAIFDCGDAGIEFRAHVVVIVENSQ